MSVTISPSAHRAFARLVQKWSGWDTSSVQFTDEVMGGTALASCDHVTRTFTFDAERLVLNPNRVINLVTPFRLKQEAVLTGAMLHEAAHARFTQWKPRTPEALAALRHADGSKVSAATLALATTLEEARIEGHMAARAGLFGAAGLEWTLRVSAMAAVPRTSLPTDPNTQILTLITGWALRAGRAEAMAYGNVFKFSPVPKWVGAYNSLLMDALEAHFAGMKADMSGISPMGRVRALLDFGVKHGDHTGVTALETAKNILDLLFPETDDEDRPVASATSCSEGGGEGDEGEGGSEGESAGEGDSEGAGTPTLQGLLDSIEKQSDADAEPTEAERNAPVDLSEGEGSSSGGGGAGRGSGPGLPGDVVAPTADARALQAEAETMLKTVLNPSESIKVSLTDSPSASVDGAALSAWRASGQHRDPVFFKRSRRHIIEAPPVKVAVLVDVSGSMDALQEPAAILSWSLTSAATDLQNYAGRGQKLEVTLIHWGDTARVITPVGSSLPGIVTVPCDEGTSAQTAALQEVENQMPGFFDESDEHRLLVQFTDWGLYYSDQQTAKPILRRGLDNGVRMVSIMPNLHHALVGLLNAATGGPHENSKVFGYDRANPAEVWRQTAKELR